MAFSDVFRALILPFLIAGIIYVALAYVILPLYRKHRSRYSSYIPLESLSTRTSSLRSRLQRALLPSFMRWRHETHFDLSRGRYTVDDSEEELFGAEEGEVMVGFDLNRGRGRLPVRGENGRVVGEEDLLVRSGEEMDSQRRLSRESEEGFKDSSEDEEGDGDDRRR